MSARTLFPSYNWKQDSDTSASLLARVVNTGDDWSPLALRLAVGVIFAVRNHCFTVFFDRPVRWLISRIGKPSHRIRLILANMLTLITPACPAQFLSRSVSTRGSVLADRDP